MKIRRTKGRGTRERRRKGEKISEGTAER